MSDTEIVLRKPDRPPASKPPLVDAELADELLARAQMEGVELLGPDGLLSQVTKAVLERALAEEMSQHRAMTSTIRSVAGRAAAATASPASGC